MKHTPEKWAELGPELLEALEAIVALHGTHEKELLRHECLKMANIARAAIAKATGQGEERGTT